MDLAKTSSLAPPRAVRDERRAAFRSLYAEHFASMYRFVCRSGISFTDAEDVTQRVFLVAHRRMTEDGLTVEHPYAWLRAIALHVVRDHRRAKKLRELRNMLFFIENEREDDHTPEHATDAMRAQALVTKILDRLPEKLREVLVLTELEGMKPQEAAEILGVPVNTVRSRKRLAREEFQKQYNRLVPGGFRA